MTAIFLDTVGLLALWDKSDQWHETASEAFAHVATELDELYATTFVLLECGNAAARRPYRLAVDRLRTRLETAGGLVFPTEKDWQIAWRDFQASAFDRAGIVDLVSFAVMRRLRIQTAFTNDHHFRVAGFETMF